MTRRCSFIFCPVIYTPSIKVRDFLFIALWYKELSSLGVSVTSKDRPRQIPEITSIPPIPKECPGSESRSSVYVAHSEVLRIVSHRKLTDPQHTMTLCNLKTCLVYLTKVTYEVWSISGARSSS